MWSMQWFKDATWRAFRTWSQSLAGLLVTVQTTNQISSNLIDIPWYAYIYSSSVAALISLLQSVDRERAVGSALPAATPAQVAPAPLVVEGPGCGGDQR